MHAVPHLVAFRERLDVFWRLHLTAAILILVSLTLPSLSPNASEPGSYYTETASVCFYSLLDPEPAS